MRETNHFFDLGYGWLCKHCSAERAETKDGLLAKTILTEHEEKEKGVTGLALARWTDASHQALSCPRCGIEEPVSKM